MPNYSYSHEDQEMPETRPGTDGADHDPQFLMNRINDGRSVVPLTYDRGDGVMVESRTIKHDPFGPRQDPTDAPEPGRGDE